MPREIDGPPDSPPYEKEIPERDCPSCGESMPYNQANNAWECLVWHGHGSEAEPCGGSIDDVDAGDDDEAFEKAGDR